MSIAKYFAVHTFIFDTKVEPQNIPLTQATMLAVRHLCTATIDDKNECHGHMHMQLSLAQGRNWYWDPQSSQRTRVQAHLVPWLHR